ncbi:hypothetical protein [Mesorhizobium sp.]|uniref:hypothetical protein n=1 Tax=Mesorhizobium sp. TaxID=1871066 RepID=UPI000FEA8015|nr:hypothetical protein [Mesorhizobium sp.]RWC58883.1 MAG: hypothetical protein EOS56_18410 [Mesorhizobium sp.]RWC66496.1 MAG: hypothetical protein EOS29_03765 [Mesorhizobium sp.]
MAALALLGLALVGCQSSSLNKHSYRPHELSAADQETVKAGVSARMKDPTSPMFGNMASSIAENGMVQVCGTVNGRNSFGAYAGAQPFTGVLTANDAGKMVFVVTGLGDGGSGNLAVGIMCRQAGIALF